VVRWSVWWRMLNIVGVGVVGENNEIYFYVLHHARESSAG